MKDIQIFRHEQFGQLRAMLNDDGEPLLMGSDVARRLGYKNPQKALRDHVDEEDKTLNESFTVNGTTPILINESGLYSLILSSKLPQAKAFKRWVTSEVLPQIRKTGGYIPTHDDNGRQLTDEQIVEQALLILGRTLRQMNAANTDCLTATEVARSWGMDVRSFNQLISRMGIQHRCGGRWQLDERLEGQQLAEVRHFLGFSLKGKPKLKDYLTWTPEGVDFLNKRLQGSGLQHAIQLNIFFKN